MAVRMSEGSVRPARRGLGDVVEVVAKPVAKVLGRPTDCLPCQKRKAHLNALSDAAIDHVTALSESATQRVNAIGRRIFRRRS